MTNKVWAECECGHVFEAAQLPMDLSEVSKAMSKAVCPECGGKKLYIGQEPTGVENAATY